MVVQYRYGGAIPLCWGSTFMVVQNLYGGAEPLWWCRTFMVVQNLYDGAVTQQNVLSAGYGKSQLLYTMYIVWP